MSAIGTLDGKPLLATSTAAWTITSGTRPHYATLDLTWKDARAVLERGLHPVELVMGDGRESTVTVQDLYVVQQVAGPDPAIGRLQVADRRWFWTSRSQRLGYNVRRRVGVRRLTTPNVAAPAQPVAPTIAYWPWSMKDGATPWTAEAVLQDLLARLRKAEQSATGAAFSSQILHGVLARLPALPMENVFLEGDLGTCLAQLLDYLPGVDCYVGADGVVVFYSKSNGAEAAMVKAAGAEKVGGGHVEPVSLANRRPRKIRICFSWEAELRFDTAESGQTSDDQDPLTMTNVMPVPDFSLAVGGVTYPRGTWLPIASVLTAWGPAPLVKGQRVLTLRDLQRACVPWNGIVEALGQLGVASTDANWGARITTAVEHYRRTYRLNPRWMGRIFHLRATRVGTLDFTTGTRGMASVYQDWSYIGTARSLYHDASQGKDLSYVSNQPCFGGGRITSDMRGIPATVEIVDEDQGIVRIRFLAHEHGVYGTVLPSQVEINGDNTTPGQRPANCGPTGDVLNNNGRPIGWNVLADPTKFPKLTSNHKAAIILTAQPGLGGFRDQDKPESPGQFCIVEVTPDQVPAFAGQDECRGPDLDVLIGPNYETARVAWTDDVENHIKGIFGIVNNVAPVPREVILNWGDAGSEQGAGASLQRIALAAATRVWHRLADRSVGSMTGTLVPRIEPAGWLSAVTHSIAQSGELSTALSLPDDVDPIALEAYLPAGVRRQLLRLANPGNAA